MVPTSVAGRACHRCGTRLADLGWSACLRCLAAPTETEEPPAIAGFERLSPIGCGGMGVVYRAYQPRLDREVAIKVIHAERAGDPLFRERFAREARLMARLAHPNVAAVYDLGEDAGHCYLVMELVDGVPLRTAGIRDALRIVDALCAALAAAHALGIVHRDIKPSNVLVCADGSVKLIDFGIATALADVTPITRTGQLVGTPAFMAPEAQRGAPPAPAMDVYAVAMLLRELTGHAPLPSHVERVLARALAANPVDRPSIAALRDGLRDRGRGRSRALAAFVVAVAALGAAASSTRESRASVHPAAAAPVVPVIASAAPGASSTRASQHAVPVAPVVAPSAAIATIESRPVPPTKVRAPAAKPKSQPPKREPSEALAPGTLVVRARPWAMVSIDGADAVRVEPPRKSLALAAGHHVIELANPVTGKRARRTVEIASGETEIVTVSLEATP